MIPIITAPSRTIWTCSRCLLAIRASWKSSTRSISTTPPRYSNTTLADQTPDLNHTRNIGIIAHIDAGKTTTTERMLYYSGFTRRLGDVDEGSTVTDFLPAEKARGITIQSAAVTFHWPPQPPSGQEVPSVQDLKAKGLPRSAISHTVNLIDTPGHADFTFEVLRSLRILDGAVCILDGVAGVEAQTEQVWHQASTYNIPRIIYINKLDRDGAAFGRTVKEVGSRLGSWPAVCQIPWFEGGDGRFIGIGDAVSLQGLRWDERGDGKDVKMVELCSLEQTDGKFAAEIKNARIALIELLSEYDETMIEKFLENDEDHLAVKPVDILECLRRCLLKGRSEVVPVFAGASFRNIGVQPLLDSVVNLLPSPKESPIPEISMGTAKGDLQGLLIGELSLEQSYKPSKHIKQKKKAAPQSLETQNPVEALGGCALAFKVVSDPKRGVLVYVRVYSGSIDRFAPLFNTLLGVSERAPRLLKMYASDAVEVQSIPAGHIGVIVGLKHARTGDTLLSYSANKGTPPEPLNTLQLRPIDIPPPVFFASVEPDSLSEEKNLHDALALLLREDPSLRVTIDEDSGQTLLSGMGELHLEIARDRLINSFKAKASMGRIEIGYRESIPGTSQAVTKIFDKEIAGRKGKAGCTALVEPYNPDLEPSETSTDDVVFSEIRDGNQVNIVAPNLVENYGAGKSRKGSNPDAVDLPSHLDAKTIKDRLYNGCLAALARGPRQSLPMHSTKITLTFNATEHIFGNETTPSALSAAARLATQAALKEAWTAASATNPPSTLMEPVMDVIISVDETSLGSVVHDISSSRGGHIVSLDDAIPSTMSHTSSSNEPPPSIDVSKIYAPPDPFGSVSSSEATSAFNRPRTITAKVPLKEMVGYLKHLRSLTGGRGTFVMSVDRFEKMGSQREKIVLSEMTGL